MSVDADFSAGQISARTAWLLTAAGVMVIAWWVWTWSKVRTLVDDHVDAHGPLPQSPIDRAGLYANGTEAQRELSADLASMTGLYPWGRLPLVVGIGLALAGWVLRNPTDRRSIALGGAISLVVAIAAIATLGDSTRVALDILE